MVDRRGAVERLEAISRSARSRAVAFEFDRGHFASTRIEAAALIASCLGSKHYLVEKIDQMTDVSVRYGYRPVEEFRGYVDAAVALIDIGPDLPAVSVGGLAHDDVARPLDEGSQSMPDSEVDPRKVFVVHGRNDKARDAIFAFLRALDLSPIEWSVAISMTKKGSPYIGDVLDAAFSQAQAIVVLQTPDDVAHLHESLTYPGDPETEPQMQPRPNVLFEAGMALGRNEERTIIAELGAVKSFSDIHGRHVVRLSNDLKARQELINRLRTAGCAVSANGTDWHSAGDLTPPPPPGGGLPLGRKLPSSQSSGTPRLSARYIDRGGNKLGEIQVTNNGPGDAFEVGVNSEQVSLHARRDGDFPVPRLPAGKSVSLYTGNIKRLGGNGPSYATVTLTAKTADGVPFTVDEFISGL